MITTLKMEYQGKERTVRVYVPEHEDGEKFPVVYMMDGQNLFDDETSTYGCWHVCDALNAEFEKSGKSAVIVGIHNDGTPMERTNELTPKSIGKLVNFPQCLFMKPMGEAFDDFIVNDVMPEIEKNFPVKVGRENTAICGSSSGGLQAYYTAVNHADVFSYAGVFSPVWLLYSVKSVVNWTKSKMKSQMPFLYIYSGGNGGLEKHIFKNSQKVIAELSNFYPQNLIKVDLRADMIHHESAWEQIFAVFIGGFLEKLQK